MIWQLTLTLTLTLRNMDIWAEIKFSIKIFKFWYTIWYEVLVCNMVCGFGIQYGIWVRPDGIPTVYRNVQTFKTGLKMSDLNMTDNMTDSVCVNYTEYFGYVTLYTAFFVIRQVYLIPEATRKLIFWLVFVCYVASRYTYTDLFFLLWNHLVFAKKSQQVNS